MSRQLHGIERYRKSSAKLNKSITVPYNECIDCSVIIPLSQYFIPYVMMKHQNIKVQITGKGDLGSGLPSYKH